MLYTNLQHIESAAELESIINSNENVMIICGSMEKNCVTIYETVEELEKKYKQVKFFDMECENPESIILLNFSEIINLNHIPLLIFFKRGTVTSVTSGYQTKEQIISFLNTNIKQIRLSL